MSIAEFVRTGNPSKQLHQADALETTSFVDVEDWLTEVFGRSTLSKRKSLFSSEYGDTKTA